MTATQLIDLVEIAIFVGGAVFVLVKFFDSILKQRGMVVERLEKIEVKLGDIMKRLMEWRR